LPRERVAVLNTVKCRPPGNRAPSKAETASCRPWLEGQLLEVEPSLVVTLGLSATRWFLGPVTLAAVRGQVPVVEGRRVLPRDQPDLRDRAGPPWPLAAGARGRIPPARQRPAGPRGPRDRRGARPCRRGGRVGRGSGGAALRQPPGRAPGTTRRRRARGHGDR